MALAEAAIWQPPLPLWLQTTLWTVCIASWVLYLPLLLATILPFMRTLSHREQIHVSPQTLRVRSRALDTDTDLTLPAGELLDVAIGCPTTKHLVGDMGGMFAPGKVIRASGVVHTLEFGGNLTREERSWLRKAVIAILLADQAPDECLEQAATGQPHKQKRPGSPTETGPLFCL